MHCGKYSNKETQILAIIYIQEINIVLTFITSNEILIFQFPA